MDGVRAVAGSHAPALVLLCSPIGRCSGYNRFSHLLNGYRMSEVVLFLAFDINQRQPLTTMRQHQTFATYGVP